MSRLNDTGSNHFPRIFRRVYRDVGAGSSGLSIDSSSREVHRLIMEFCENGDLNDSISEP